MWSWLIFKKVALTGAKQLPFGDIFWWLWSSTFWCEIILPTVLLLALSWLWRKPGFGWPRLVCWLKKWANPEEPATTDQVPQQYHLHHVHSEDVQLSDGRHVVRTTTDEWDITATPEELTQILEIQGHVIESTSVALDSAAETRVQIPLGPMLDTVDGLMDEGINLRGVALSGAIASGVKEDRPVQTVMSADHEG